MPLSEAGKLMTDDELAMSWMGSAMAAVGALAWFMFKRNVAHTDKRLNDLESEVANKVNKEDLESALARSLQPITQYILEEKDYRKAHGRRIEDFMTEIRNRDLDTESRLARMEGQREIK